MSKQRFFLISSRLPYITRGALSFLASNASSSTSDGRTIRGLVSTAGAELCWRRNGMLLFVAHRAAYHKRAGGGRSSGINNDAARHRGRDAHIIICH